MNQVYFILIILHVMLSAVYAADYALTGESRKLQGALFRFVIIFMIPVFGFVFMWYADFYENKMKKENGRDLKLIMENNAELELLKPIDVSDEINKVPMVEALQMGDYSYRRKMVVDTLKEDDTLAYLDVLREALLNEDTETSHYASAIIMDVQGKLQDSLFRKEIAFHENMEDLDAAFEYEKELYKVIKSGIYDSRNLNKYYVKYKVVSDRILKEKNVSEDCYHNRIDVDFATEDIVHAQTMCELYKKKFPTSEEMVVDNIKLCIKMEDRERLDEFLEELKSLPVLLTSYSLQYVRFFERKNGK